MIKLNVGCGGKKLEPGFTGVDIRKVGEVSVVCNSWELDKHYSENTVDYIYSRHSLEHLTFYQVKETLKVWNKVLKVGGTVEIMVPDLIFTINQILAPKGSLSPFKRKWTNRVHGFGSLFGWQRETDTGEVWDVHKSGYDEELMTEYLQKTGFKNIKRIKEMDWNLLMTAQK